MITNIVLNRHANRDRQELLKIIDKFEGNGVKDVILACTDLQLLIPHHKLNIYDTENFCRCNSRLYFEVMTLRPSTV